MSGAIMARCLVPPKLGGSSGAAELIMASLAVKEAVARRIQAAELRQGPWGHTLLYLGALALYVTAADQVSGEMKYLAAKLATAQEARTQGKVKIEKSDGSCQPPETLPKPLQGKEFVFKRGRLLGFKPTPPAKPGSGAAPEVVADEAKEMSLRPRRALLGSAPGSWGRTLKELPGRGRP